MMNIKWKTLMWVLVISSLLFGGCTPQDIQLTEIPNNAETNLPTMTPQPSSTTTPEPTTLTSSPTITPASPEVEKAEEPAVSILPTSGPTGTVVQVIASGFPPNSEITLGFGPEGSEFSLAAEGVTDANGTFSAPITVQMGAGTNLVFAAAVPGERGVNAPEMFQVTAEPEPAVSISPTSGPQGTVVLVVASGFPPNSEINLGFGPAGSQFSTAAQGRTDANGTFSASVPVEMEAGMNVIFAAAVIGEQIVNASDMFLVADTTATPTPYMDMWTTFANPTFAVSVDYPADWQPVPGYGDPDAGTERIGSVNGFFQINAMDSDSIDAAAEAEAWHKLQPYGSSPTVEMLQVQGQDARIIIPSDDQPDGMQHQAALIVRYPQPVTISGTSYRYFILWADYSHIRTIAQTIVFLEVTE